MSTGHRPKIKVYGTPWCPDCRRSKRFLDSHRIPYEWINIDEDESGLRYVEEVQGGGRTIPTIVFEDGSHLFEPSDQELAEKLGLQVEATHFLYDLLVVGGGPAGLTASMYAAREGIETLVVESGNLGGQAGITEQIDNYPGFPQGIRGADLVDNFVAQARRHGVELLATTSALSLLPADGKLELKLSNGQIVSAHAVILSVGSTYRRLGVPGEDALIGRGVHYCATCDGPFYRGASEAIVIGGGNSGFEEAFFLLRFVDHVTILERSSRPRASRVLQEKAASDPRITVLTDMAVSSLLGKEKLEGVAARNTRTSEEFVFDASAAFVFVGLEPNTDFLEGTVELDDRGFIVTDDAFRTSLAGVFAAGDARAGSTKQVASAVGEGATASIMVRDYLASLGYLHSRLTWKS